MSCFFMLQVIVASQPRAGKPQEMVTYITCHLTQHATNLRQTLWRILILMRMRMRMRISFAQHMCHV